MPAIGEPLEIGKGRVLREVSKVAILSFGTRLQECLKAADKLAAYAAANGVLVLTCGTYGNVIRFLPPLTIDDELLVEGLDILAEGLKQA